MDPMSQAKYTISTEGYNINNIYQKAMQNPKAFEEHIKRTNPQAYQRALSIARAQNPQQAVMQILQSRGINPGSINLPGLK